MPVAFGHARHASLCVVPQLLRHLHQKLATGYRASKIIGSSVVNRNNDKIGTIDDLIVEPRQKVPYAVLSVGDSLGVGDHLVVVPFNSLQISENKIELTGATKDEIKALPEFRYTTR